MSAAWHGEFLFTHLPELTNLPQAAAPHEVDLHGTFTTDKRDGFGQLYCGIMRIDADLQTQSMNVHSTELGLFDGNQRLILSANNDEQVVILTLDGNVVCCY